MGLRGGLAVFVVAGCAATGEPRLDAIDPGVVTATAPTPAVLEGEHLYAAASVSLDDDLPVQIERRWQIRIGAVEIAEDGVVWRSPEQIDVVIPAGLAAGVYDVIATSPRGREVVLPAGITVVAGPCLDHETRPVCSDGSDNDCDGVADADDPDCSNTPPTPAIRVTPPAGTPADVFLADASGTVDREDPADALIYRWDWDGDGTFEATGPTSTGSLPDLGERAVTLRVDDTGGLSAYASFVVVVSPAGDLLVVTTGIDEDDPGATPGSPGGTGLSLREAMNVADATPGQQTILIPPGTVVALALQLPTPPDPAGVRVVGDGAILDGSGIPGAASSCFDIASSNNRIYGLEITGCRGWPIYLYGSATGNRIARCDLHDNGFQVLLGGTDNTFGPANRLRGTGNVPGVVVNGRHVIEWNRFLGNPGGPAVRLTASADDALVLGNLIHGYNVGVEIESGADGVRLWHDTIHGNVSHGVTIANNVSGTDMRNTIVSHNDGWAVRGTALNFGRLEFDAYFANASGVCSACTPGPNTIELDPLYIDEAALDLRLLWTSPLVDAGADLGVDVNGPAPGAHDGAGPDLGAHESY